jgi:hypothetical protein
MGKLAAGVFPRWAWDRTETAWNAIKLTQASNMADEYMHPGLRISAVSGAGNELPCLRTECACCVSAGGRFFFIEDCTRQEWKFFPVERVPVKGTTVADWRKACQIARKLSKN